MSLLRSFSFYPNEIKEEDLLLFEFLIRNPDYKSEYSYDILTAAMEGRINKNLPFNLVGYETRIRVNNKLCLSKKKKKEVSYDAPINDDTDASISEFIKEPRDDISELIDKELYNEALNFILSNDYYLVNTKDCLILDLKLCLSNALIGIPDAVKYIKLACDTDSRLRDYIEVLLTYGIDDDIKEKLRG